MKWRATKRGASLRPGAFLLLASVAFYGVSVAQQAFATAASAIQMRRRRRVMQIAPRLAEAEPPLKGVIRIKPPRIRAPPPSEPPAEELEAEVVEIEAPRAQTIRAPPPSGPPEEELEAEVAEVEAPRAARTIRAPPPSGPPPKAPKTEAAEAEVLPETPLKGIVRVSPPRVPPPSVPPSEEPELDIEVQQLQDKPQTKARVAKRRKKPDPSNKAGVVAQVPIREGDIVLKEHESYYYFAQVVAVEKSKGKADVRYYVDDASESDCNIRELVRVQKSQMQQLIPSEIEVLYRDEEYFAAKVSSVSKDSETLTAEYLSEDGDAVETDNAVDILTSVRFEAERLDLPLASAAKGAQEPARVEERSKAADEQDEVPLEERDTGRDEIEAQPLRGVGAQEPRGARKEQVRPESAKPGELEVKEGDPVLALDYEHYYFAKVTKLRGEMVDLKWGLDGTSGEALARDLVPAPELDKLLPASGKIDVLSEDIYYEVSVIEIDNAAGHAFVDYLDEDGEVSEMEEEVDIMARVRIPEKTLKATLRQLKKKSEQQRSRGGGGGGGGRGGGGGGGRAQGDGSRASASKKKGQKEERTNKRDEKSRFAVGDRLKVSYEGPDDIYDVQVIEVGKDGLLKIEYLLDKSVEEDFSPYDGRVVKRLPG